MNLTRDLPQIVRNFNHLKKKKEYQAYFKEYTARAKNPWFTYNRITPKVDEVLFSFHNHSDGYTLFEIAEVAARQGYKFFALTNHSDDSQFNGKRIIYSKDHDVFLLRGMECRCQEPSPGTEDYWSINEGKYKTHKILGAETDALFIGYEGHIDSFKPFYETVQTAKKQNALIQLTSPLNRAAKGPNEVTMRLVLPYVDAIETFDSNNVSFLSIADIVAAKWLDGYNSKLPLDKRIAGVYANDAHTLQEIGGAGVGFKEEDFEKFIYDSRYTKTHVDELLDTIKNSLKKGRYSNYGNYAPRFSFIYPDKLRSIARDMLLRPFDSDEGEWDY